MPLGGGDTAPPMHERDTGPREFRLSEVRFAPTKTMIGQFGNTYEAGTGILGGETAVGVTGAGVTGAGVTGAGGGYGWSTVTNKRIERRQTDNAKSQSWGKMPYQSSRREPRVDGKSVLSKGCFTCGKEGHVARKCPEKLAHVLCVSCHTKGHYASECEENRAKGRDGACFRCGKYGHQKRECETLEEDFADVIEIPLSETNKEHQSERVDHSDTSYSDTDENERVKTKTYSSILSFTSPQERASQMLEHKFQKQPVLTLKFQLSPGMRLVKEHVETAAALIGIKESGLVLGMMFEYNFVKLLMNKQKIGNLSDFCSEIKQEIIPGVVLAWSRQGEHKTFNVVIKGLDWDVPNGLIKAYLNCFGSVSNDGVKWADMDETSWPAERNPDTGRSTKLASGERLARITTKRSQLPRDHLLRGKRFLIEHRGQRTCRNCLGGPTECKSNCDHIVCKEERDLKKEWKDIIRNRCDKEGLDFDKLNHFQHKSPADEPSDTEPDDLHEDTDDQFNSSFYERGRPVIRELENNKPLIAIELLGVVATKTEEEAGELIWALMEKEVDDDANINAIRELWCNSVIDMDSSMTKKSFTKMVIKVEGEYEEESFIVQVWNLLRKVCFRTGMSIVPIYGKDDHDADSSKRKEKHYLISCLEDVRKKISQRNIEEEVAKSDENNVVHKFDLNEWITSSLGKGKKKLSTKNKSRHRDATSIKDEKVKHELIKLCDEMDKCINEILTTKPEDINLQKQIEYVLQLESWIKVIGFEWRPNLGAFKSPTVQEKDDKEETTTSVEEQHKNKTIQPPSEDETEDVSLKKDAIVSGEQPNREERFGSVLPAGDEEDDEMFHDDEDTEQVGSPADDELATVGIVAGLINDVIGSIPEQKDDSLEVNFGLLSALKEISGMVSPPPAMDWSISHVNSLLTDRELNPTSKDSIHQELANSVLSSTPMITEARVKKFHPSFITNHILTSVGLKGRKRTSSLPGCKDYEDENDEHDEYVQDEEDTRYFEEGKSSEEIIEDLKEEFGKNGDISKDIELKIDRLLKAPPDKKEMIMTTKIPNENFTEQKKAMKMNLIGNSSFARLSQWKSQRKDGKERRCGKCASCRSKCGDCQACLGDKKKSKLGCRKRFVCLKNSTYIDEPDLINGPLKRYRDEEMEDGTSCKGLKLSFSPEDEESTSYVEHSKDKVQHVVLHC